MREERARAELRVREAVATRFALDDARRRALLLLALDDDGERLGLHARLRAELARGRRCALRASPRGRTRRRSRSRRACAYRPARPRGSSLARRRLRPCRTGARGGSRRALRYSRARKPSSSPTLMWSQGRRAVTGMVPRYPFGSIPSASKAAAHTSIFSWSSHESKRAPRLKARSSTSHSFRSPRAKTPSSHEVVAVVHAEVHAASAAPPPPASPASRGRRPRRPWRTTGTACAAWGRGSRR